MFEDVQPVILLYKPGPAVCRDYDPRTVAVARLVAALVQENLPAVQVEHVGSTAVPGCAGKGIVDLMIPCRDGDELASVKELLEKLGFQPQTNREPFPEDRPMRVGAIDHDGQTFPLHVHVIPADSPEVEEMRFFRACLRADSQLLKLYVAKKKQIIDDGVTDSLEYLHAKGEFIKMVLG